MKRELSGETVQRVARDHDATNRELVTAQLPAGSALREEVVGTIWMVIGDYLDGDPDAERWLRSEEGGEHLHALGFAQSRFLVRLREIQSDPGLRASVEKITHRHERAKFWLHAMAAVSRQAA